MTGMDNFRIRGRQGWHSMKRMSVPYGKDKLDIALDGKNILDVVYPKETARKKSSRVLANAIAEPVDGQTLNDFLGTSEPVLCIVNDATRPTKTSAVLDIIKNNIRNSTIQFLIATGAHRAPTDQEMLTIFGSHLRAYNDRIMVHDACDDKTADYYGETRYGNALWLNSALKRFGRILIIGSVEPHYFAGFTGGRKAILPGVAAYRTIEQNHKHANQPGAKPLNLIGNPVHEEMIDCMITFHDKRLLSLQMVLDRNHNIHEAFTGSVEKTFETASRAASELYRIEIAAKADIVVTVAKPPFDINLYQTLKAIEHGRMALKEGGVLIVVSPCYEGLGPRSFARLFSSSKSIEDAVNNARTCYHLGDHNAINLASLANQAEVWMVTNIPDRILLNARMKWSKSLQHAISQAIDKQGRSARVLFLMDGCFTVPILT